MGPDSGHSTLHVLREQYWPDINNPVIEIAKAKQLPEHVEFQVADMYKHHSRSFDELFGGFIFSHIPRQEQAVFFQKINALVRPHGQIVLMDNRYVEGSNLPVTDTDDFENTFQTRKLDNGTSHKVLKNFPGEDELRNLVKVFAEDVRFIGTEYFWILAFRVKQ